MFNDSFNHCYYFTVPCTCILFGFHRGGFTHSANCAASLKAGTDVVYSTGELNHCRSALLIRPHSVHNPPAGVVNGYLP